MTKYYIAADGGGTKTEFLLFDGGGKILSRAVLGGSNPNAVGMETACARLAEGVTASAAAVKDGGALCGFFGGVAGSASGENGKIITSYLQEQFPALPVAIGSDIWNVFYSVPENCPLAAISGTGSIVYTRAGADGETLERFGGWGYLFDHEGSGYDLGRDVLTHCLACDDRLETRGTLTELAEAKLGGQAKPKLDILYKNGRDFIASFAPLVFEALRRGDSNGAAAQILDRNAARLAELICHAAKMLGKGDAPAPCILAGGLTRNPEWTAAIEAKLPQNLSLILPAVGENPAQPILGAARRALALFGREDADFLDTVTKSYKEICTL